MEEKSSIVMCLHNDVHELRSRLCDLNLQCNDNDMRYYSILKDRYVEKYKFTNTYSENFFSSHKTYNGSNSECIMNDFFHFMICDNFIDIFPMMTAIERFVIDILYEYNRTLFCKENLVCYDCIDHCENDFIRNFRAYILSCDIEKKKSNLKNVLWGIYRDVDTDKYNLTHVQRLFISELINFFDENIISIVTPNYVINRIEECIQEEVYDIINIRKKYIDNEILEIQKIFYNFVDQLALEIKCDSDNIEKIVIEGMLLNYNKYIEELYLLHAYKVLDVCKNKGMNFCQIKISLWKEYSLLSLKIDRLQSDVVYNIKMYFINNIMSHCHYLVDYV